MRLGLWNRLAVVVTVLACLIAPTWIWLDMSNSTYASRQTWYEICMGLAQEKLDLAEASAAQTECLNDRYAPTGLGWWEWWQAVGGTLLVCAVIYGLSRLIVWTAKWVWRGRNVNPRSQASP